MATEVETGQAAEQMKTAPGKTMNQTGMAGGWKQERREADSLLRSLYQAHCEDEKHREWLLRRWPEWFREGSNGALPDPERFIPESYLREDDVSQSCQAIKNLVKEGLGLLQGDDDEDGKLNVPGMVAKLSDEGVVECIPVLLPKLRRKALQTILSTLSEWRRAARNRQWLIEKFTKEWMTFAGQPKKSASRRTKMREIVAVFRDPDSFLQETVPGRLSLEAFCPYSAARSALTLTQLEQLPLSCLHVMLEVLLEKPPDVMIGKLPAGGNKERVVAALLERGGALLSYDQAGEALPESLRKSLMVMSVSARYAFGSDGNLVDFLGPLSLETQVLQDDLLSALSHLKKLNYENLELVHKMLLLSPNIYEKRHPGNFRYPIKRVLLDCLLRSEVRSVPEEVKTVAVTIRTLAMKQVDEEGQPPGDGQPVSDSTLKDSGGDDARIELEVESTLRISSHLLQIMYNWKEVLSRSSEEECPITFSGSNGANCSSVPGRGTSGITETTPRNSSTDDVVQLGEESLAADMTDGGVEHIRSRLESDSIYESAQVLQIEWTNTTSSNRPYDCEAIEIDGTPAEAMENKRLTTIADEAAEVGYALVGCAMERTARSSGVSLKRPVRKYLRSGTMKKVRAHSGDVGEHQLGMILKIAEKIPAISPRVMDNVKRRLGMG
ncbi:unnamed protein product [Calypogeia fissa]